MPRAFKPKGLSIKKNVYLSEATEDELYRESQRQQRTYSWLLNAAWEIAKDTIARFPTIDNEGRVVPADE